MIPESQQLTRQAYLDEELSVEQTIAFEESLSADERQELEALGAFDEELAARLSAPVPCPDMLWVRLQKQIQTEQHANQGIRVLFTRKVLGLAAALAVVLIALFALWPNSKPPVLAGLPVEPEALGAEMEIHGDFQKISAALAAHGIFVKVNQPAPRQHHAITMLGMRMLKEGNAPVAELAFSCCGQPVVVYVSEKKAKWSLHNLPRALPQKWFMGGSEIDNYKIMVVSPHTTQAVMDLFS